MRIELYILLGVAAIPFIYYLLALYSTWKFFAEPERSTSNEPAFTPPVSCLKPIKGLDEGAYENFASFCRQDYPEYEILFCVDENDPALPVLKRLMQDFPTQESGCCTVLITWRSTTKWRGSTGYPRKRVTMFGFLRMETCAWNLDICVAWLRRCKTRRLAAPLFFIR